jgi:hypothetical protein
MKKELLMLLSLFIFAFIVCGASAAATVKINQISNVGAVSSVSVGSHNLTENSKINQVSTKSVFSAAAPTLGQALDNTKLTWTTTTANYYKPWKGNTTKSHDGKSAAVASSFNYGYSPVLSKLQTTVYGPGKITFYWMKYYYVSTQDFTYVNAYGSCLFYFKDNNKTIYSMDKFSKNSAWSQKSYSLGAGKHILTWNTLLNCPANSILTPMAYWHWNSLSAYVDQVQWIPAPKISSTTPTNLKTGVNRFSTTLIKFNENIKASSYYYKITIKNLTTGKYSILTKTISGSYLSIKTSAKSKYTWYQVTIPKAAIKDYAGNNLQATYTFKFKTGP